MKKLQTTLDKITTLISAILCAAMMVILFANVVLRLIPGIGGFKWYMESSQYLNVWSMLIVCIGINAMGTNLRVEVVDSILGKTPLGKKIVVIIRDVFIILFLRHGHLRRLPAVHPRKAGRFHHAAVHHGSGVHHLPHCRCAVHPVRRSQPDR